MFQNQADHIEICQSLEQQPDRFYFDNSNDGVAMSTAALDINNNKNGDWYFNNVSNDMCYMGLYNFDLYFVKLLHIQV